MLWLAYLVYNSESKHVFTNIRHLHYDILSGLHSANRGSKLKCFLGVGHIKSMCEITVGIGNVRT